MNNNHLFYTTDFREAAFYIARGILFVRKESAPNEEKVTFVLQTVPQEYQSDWQAHRDTVSARALFGAQDFLRDILKDKKPRF